MKRPNLLDTPLTSASETVAILLLMYMTLFITLLIISIGVVGTCAVLIHCE